MMGSKPGRWKLGAAGGVLLAAVGCGIFQWSGQASTVPSSSVSSEAVQMVSAAPPDSAAAEPEAVQKPLAAEVVTAVDHEDMTAAAASPASPGTDSAELSLESEPLTAVQPDLTAGTAAVAAPSVHPKSIPSAAGAGQSRAIVQSLQQRHTPPTNYKVAEADDDIVLDAVAMADGPDTAAVSGQPDKSAATVHQAVRSQEKKK